MQISQNHTSSTHLFWFAKGHITKMLRKIGLLIRNPHGILGMIHAQFAVLHVKHLPEHVGMSLNSGYNYCGINHTHCGHTTVI